MQKKRHIAAVMELNCSFKRHYNIFAGIQKYADSHADWSFEIGNYPEVLMAKGVTFDGIIGRISKDCLVAARDADTPVVNVHLNSRVYSKVHGVYSDFYTTACVRLRENTATPVPAMWSIPSLIRLVIIGRGFSSMSKNPNRAGNIRWG